MRACLVPDTVVIFICFTEYNSQHYPMRKVPKEKKAEIFLKKMKVGEREKAKRSGQLLCSISNKSSKVTWLVE